MAKHRPEPELPPCYALTLPGLEEIAGEEITQDLRGEVRKTERGLVVFRVRAIDRDLLRLRTVEDVFLYAWGTDQLTYRAADLDRIQRWTAREPDWDQLLKLHHSIADGQGTVQMFEILHGDAPEPGRARALPVPAPERVSGTSIALDTLQSAPGRLLRETVGTGARIASGALHARPHKVLDAIRYAGSLGRMLGPPPAQGSILLEQRSLNRRYGALEVPLDELRAAGKACGGTVNDAFVSALVGGMRRYHDHHGIELGELTLALPISLRKEGDPPGSNRFAGARILAPLGELNPRTRMRIIGELTAGARSEPAIGFMDALSPVMSRLPAALVATMTERVTRSIDLQASNVRGLDRTAFIAGARVERMYAFGAAPGPAVMVTLMSYDGVCYVAVTVNAAAMPDHELFVQCVQAGLDEVVAVGRPKRRRAPTGGTAGAA